MGIWFFVIFKGDHDTLVDITEELCKRSEKKNSLIVRFYMHMEDIKTGRFMMFPIHRLEFVLEMEWRKCDSNKNRYYAAMQNVFYVEGQKKIVWKYLFDLKGCKDDKLLTLDGEKIEVIWSKLYSLP